MKSPDFDEVTETIKNYLKTFRKGKKHVEVGFFGGTFTGIPEKIQEDYLQAVQPFLVSGEVQGIRLSTRPDYIDKTVLDRLRRYGVTTIELGAQSLDDEVLRLSRRGHTVQQVKQASEMIRNEGFHLGLQMMIGLPGDTFEKALATADKIIAFGADNTRIYPTLVIKGTVLHHWFVQGTYRPLSLANAVQWSKALLLKFEQAGVCVIRLGLHPSDGLLSGEELVAGPFHPSFRELVLTEIWHDILTPLLKKTSVDMPVHLIEIPVGQINYAVGYGGKNKKLLQTVFQDVRFRENDHLSGRNFIVH